MNTNTAPMDLYRQHCGPLSMQANNVLELAYGYNKITDGMYKDWLSTLIDYASKLDRGQVTPCEYVQMAECCIITMERHLNA